ncbi:MAG TPA: hypothetical protein VJN64_11695 [Terriglobales bacterium]|nr:hypothetical protein [Terriglobales bacterium]
MSIWEELADHPGVEVGFKRLSRERMLFRVCCDVTRVTEEEIEHFTEELELDHAEFEILRFKGAATC